MVLYGIRLIINIFDLFIYQRYLETYIEKRKTTVEFSAFLVIVCEIIGSAINQLGVNWLNLVTMFGVLCIITSQYQAKLISKAMAVLLYMGIAVVCEPIGYIVNKAFMEELIKDETASYYFVVFFMAFLQAVIIELFCRLKSGKKIQISSMPKETLYMLTTIPLASLISCFLLIEISNELISAQTMILCMCIIFTIIVMNYIIFLLIERYTSIAEKQYEEELLQTEAAYREEYYQDIEQYQEQVQDMKHDMKNRLLTLYSAAEEGRNDVIKQRLSEMMGDIQLAEDMIYSANPVLNSILKVKALKAKEIGAKFLIQTLIPRQISVEAGDMGVLYGNLIDNALEACAGVQTEKRVIHFETKYQEEKLLIMIENSKQEVDNPEMKTSKNNKRMHGRGIRSVRKLAEKYGGNLVLEDKGDTFKTSLLLTNIACLE